jgi:predicted small lipoprotein YifL
MQIFWVLVFIVPRVALSVYFCLTLSDLKQAMFKNICWANWLYTLMIVGLFLLSLSTVLTGCGNKGALTLPDKSVTQQASKKVK